MLPCLLMKSGGGTTKNSEGTSVDTLMTLMFLNLHIDAVTGVYTDT